MSTSPRWTRAAGLALPPYLLLVATLEASGINYDTARLDRRMPAIRAVGAIVVDGVLDEQDWSRAPLAKGFVQNDPHEGEAASEDTEVRVLYDAKNLYIGVFARDREPQHIITSELQKDFDRGKGDDFEVVLDTFHDERNGYMFATNARGAKWDAQMSNEGREINANWDALWDVKTHVTEAGWYAEIAIPFRTLRFGSEDVQTWGINFQRRIRRRNEDSFWSPLPRIYDLQRVSLAGTLEGLRGVRPGSDLRIKPYVLASSGKSTRVKLGNDFDQGLDVKYGVTSGLTWDFTLNTDFSQVEADEQQINLTRFSLFFPEKRDFFLENSGIFRFDGSARPGAGGSTVGRVNVQQDVVLFFSRRIGLSDSGEMIPILGGTRLTGHVGDFNVGVLNIQQRGTASSPATNFTALRLRRNVLSNSDVGVMLLNKDGEGPRYNRVAGVDANLRFFRNLNVYGFAAKTMSPSISIAGTGQDELARGEVNYKDRHVEAKASYLTIGERVNDEMGFLPRTGIHKFHTRLGAYVRPKTLSRWVRDIGPHFEFENIERVNGKLDSRYVDLHLPFNFQDSSFLEVGMNPSTENLEVPFRINPRRGIAIAPGHYAFKEWFATWRTNSSAPFAVTGRWAVGDFYDGDKQTYQISGATQWSGRLNASVSLTRNQLQLRAGNYSTNLIAARVKYGFSTRTLFNGLVQYNTDVREWSSNMRLNIIHRPLSDFFLVYNERRDTQGTGLIDRALVGKVTYMVAF